jgi:hypothetical protein
MLCNLAKLGTALTTQAFKRSAGALSQFQGRQASHAAASPSASSSSDGATQPAAEHMPGLHVVPFPQLSPVMNSGRLTKWLKQPGDRVELVSCMNGCT